MSAIVFFPVIFGYKLGSLTASLLSLDLSIVEDNGVTYEQTQADIAKLVTLFKGSSNATNDISNTP